MTREEAIKELKEDIELYIPLRGTIDDVDRDLPDGRLITALEMAIQALEQEPCGDAISRQAVLDITWEEPSYTDALNVLTEVRDKVKELPSVNPQEPKIDTWSIKDVADTLAKYGLIVEQEPKTGHWIQTNECFLNQDGQFIYKFICSECKSLSYFRKSNKKAIGANVCPNCGAKMVEPQESEG